MKQWYCHKYENGLTEVEPIDDLHEHDHSTGCPCSPELKEGNRLLVHNAWDNREVVEIFFNKEI